MMLQDADYTPTEEEKNIRLRVLDIVAGTSVDGPGLRTSIYLAGCDHACQDVTIRNRGLTTEAAR